ncbi:MAG: hypothetical protein IKX44_02775 [Prevotella sp.]|nr:hypothetical protein [Prevotella sp.]
MSFKENDPDNQEGLNSQPSPAEIIRQMMDKLRELLHEHPRNSGITINYYNSVGQRIDSVTTQNFSSDKWLRKSHHTPVDDTKQEEREPKEETPPPEVMAWAVEKTIRDGYWWGNVSWSVVYRIYQMKGYRGSISQFVRDVSQWPFTKRLPYECNYDAIQKPVTSGKLCGMPENWRDNGAHEQTVKLGMALMEELDKNGDRET